MEIGNWEGEIIKIAEQVKMLFGTIKKQEQMVQTIQELAVEVRGISHQVKTVTDDLSEARADIGELKNKPSKRWEQLVGLLIAALVGYLIRQIGM